MKPDKHKEIAQKAGYLAGALIGLCIIALIVALTVWIIMRLFYIL